MSRPPCDCLTIEEHLSRCNGEPPAIAAGEAPRILCLADDLGPAQVVPLRSHKGAPAGGWRDREPAALERVAS